MRSMGSIKTNAPKKRKISKEGEGSAPKIKKSNIQNFDFLVSGRGSLHFQVFPKFKEYTLNASVEQKII